MQMKDLLIPAQDYIELHLEGDISIKFKLIERLYSEEETWYYPKLYIQSKYINYSPHDSGESITDYELYAICSNLIKLYNGNKKRKIIECIEPWFKFEFDYPSFIWTIYLWDEHGIPTENCIVLNIWKEGDIEILLDYFIPTINKNPYLSLKKLPHKKRNK